ncbi:hypothetical protein B0H14DRAFT_3529010 [Mycena olivaceomarginata]|nr:hypothetical protein B0H14DRAFT_3529010 [Mycena olivaceomarginata]
MERRPHISPIFIPPHFTSNLASPSTFGTPDNGYQSSFTPASTSGLQFQYNNIPASPLEKRRNPPPYPADLPDLQDVSDDEDDSEEEEEPIPVNGAKRLLALYNARSRPITALQCPSTMHMPNEFHKPLHAERARYMLTLP